ncbi:MAG: hypothetical protein CSA72_04675 [Rhodobacterales bacterium]|nr:MAG: hypothetical protein CSA72_04675 [Rhodobacterales bacterium]
MIPDEIQADLTTRILNTEANHIADLIRDWRLNRQLSDVMGALNMQLLTGTPTEQTQAKAALSHLGFL